MRLLFLVTEDWYFVSHRLALACAASRAGFDVVVATRVGRHRETIQRSGVRVIDFPLSRGIGNPFAELLAIYRLYRAERPDLVHHVALKPVIYGSLAAGMASVPTLVNTIAGLGRLFSSRWIVARLLRPSLRALLAHIARMRNGRVIVQNPNDRNILIAAGAPAEHIRLIRGSGVDIYAFTPAPAPAGQVRVLLASRMLRDKGIPEFVEAARRLREEGLHARFILAGAPDLGNPSSISETQLNAWYQSGVIEWQGHSHDMPSTLADCHVVCLPTTYGEGVPKVLLEAAACARPIVACDVPGCREIVKEGENGLLIPPGDVPALASALRKLIADPDLRTRMGAHGRKLAVDQFSQERVNAAILDVYRELLG